MIVREEEAWTSDAFWLRLYQCKLPVWGFAPLNVRVLLCLQESSTVFISLCLNYSSSVFLHIWLL